MRQNGTFYRNFCESVVIQESYCNVAEHRSHHFETKLCYMHHGHLQTRIRVAIIQNIYMVYLIAGATMMGFG